MADKITVQISGGNTRTIMAYRPTQPDAQVTHAIDEACRAVEQETGKAVNQSIRHTLSADDTPIALIIISPSELDVNKPHYAHEAE
jgi:hypothetical protein